MMTKKQASNKFLLPMDADQETIRMRFAARYSLCDREYDHCLTSGMRNIHEQHLRELEDAYKVLSGSKVISDMGAILSLGKGYIEEDAEAKAPAAADKTVLSDEALAFFALDPDASPTLAQDRYAFYVKELETAMNAVGLEASKEPYRQEIKKAGICLQVAVNYLVAGQLLSLEEEEQPSTPAAPATGAAARPSQPLRRQPVVAPPAPATKKTKINPLALLALGVVLLIGGIWIGKQLSTTDPDQTPLSPEQPIAVADNKAPTQQEPAQKQQRTPDQPSEPKNTPPSSASNRQRPPADNTTGSGEGSVDAGVAATKATSPTQKPAHERLEELLKEYSGNTTVKVTAAGFIHWKSNGEDKRVLIQYISSFSPKGEFVGHTSQGKDTIFSGFALKESTSGATREQIHATLREIKPDPMDIPVSSKPKPAVPSRTPDSSPSKKKATTDSVPKTKAKTQEVETESQWEYDGDKREQRTR